MTRFSHASGVFLFALATLAATPAALAQEGGGEAAETPALQTRAPDPFDDAPAVLQARRLRGLRAEIAGLVLLADPGGNLALEALALPLGPSSEGRVRVPVFVEIDGSNFLEHNQAELARVEVYVYALGPGNAIAGYLAEAFPVAIDRHGEAIWQSGLKYYGELELPPGEYRLRVLVRNFQSKSAGLREIRLTVPEPSVAAAFPLFDAPAARDAWLPVRTWGEGPFAEEEPYPLVAENRALRPTARPVVVAGRKAQIWTLAEALPAGRLRAAIELVGENEEVTRVDAELVGRHPLPGLGAGLELIELSFEPPELTPASYPLRVAFQGGGVELTSGELPVFVLDPSTRERALLWTDLRWLMAGGSKAPAQTAARERPDPEKVEKRRSRRRERRRQVAALADEYRQVLRTLAEGSETAARAALFDLESQVLDRSSPNSLLALQAAELTVAEELAESELESLIPLIMLHDELYQTYRQRRVFSLVFHTRTMVELFAELYARHGKSQGSRVVAARVLSSLGGYLQDANLPASSREVFNRALDHDPTSPAALLALAASYEKYGDFAEARRLLQTLVEAHPRFAEARLRLGINLERTGGGPLARGEFEKVLELEAPLWVRTLAYQELARSWLATGGADRAAEILEQAIEEIPGEESNYLLLAHVYDRLQSPNQAFELVRLATGLDQKVSARKIYDSWPEGALAEARSALAKAAEVRRVSLERLLGASGGEDTGEQGQGVGS